MDRSAANWEAMQRSASKNKGGIGRPITTRKRPPMRAMESFFFINQEHSFLLNYSPSHFQKPSIYPILPSLGTFRSSRSSRLLVSFCHTHTHPLHLFPTQTPFSIVISLPLYPPPSPSSYHPHHLYFPCPPPPPPLGVPLCDNVRLILN
jgi:hypothetical protein